MSLFQPLKLNATLFKKPVTLFSLFLLPFSGLAQEEKYSQIYDSDQIINKGIELHQAQRYAEALQQYDKILRPDSDYLRAQYEKLLTLSEQGNKEEVLQILEKLYRQGDMVEWPDLLVLYGSKLSDAERYAEAEKILLEAEKLMPHSSIVLFNQSIVYIRTEQKQKAVDALKKSITYNPNHATGHYLLGLMAYESGKIVEGSLAMLAYLTISPTGKFSQEAVLKLNTKMGQDFLKKDNLVYSDKGDDFSELELILRNQLPLHQKYKVKSTIDDIVTRQVQAIMEYAATHKLKDGFFENIYIPYLADIHKRDLTEAFTYYILLSFEEPLGKKLSTHKKKIIDFAEKYISGDMWEIYGRRKLEHFGSVQEVVVYLEDGYPSLIGKQENGKFHGRFKIVDKHGKLLGEINYKQGLLDGVQTYYFLNGKKSNYLTFVNGEQSGEFKEYYTNGNIQAEGTYKKGEIDGKYIYYHPNGGKSCERNFVNGQLHGTSVCYYPNGQIKNEYNYVNGKLHGKTVDYNPIGKITQISTYVDDQMDGDAFYYFDGTQVKTHGKYEKGVPVGIFKDYYENGAVNKEYLFENGNVKHIKEYFANGKVYSESMFDNKGQLEKQIYFDENGKKYFEERFKGGKTKVGYQYTPSSDQPIEVPLKKDLYEMKDLNGTLRVAGYYSKGTMNGMWEYYKSNGKLNFKQNYKNDKMWGLRYDYDEQGRILGIYYQAEGGVLSGLYEGFRGDKPFVNMYFKDGQRNGPFQYLYPNGNISYEGYYIDGNSALNHYYYSQSGKLQKSYEFINNQMTKIKSYNPDDSTESELVLANLSKKADITYNRGLVISSTDYKNGVRNGRVVTKTQKGELISDIEMVNDVNHGKYVFYNGTGKLASEATFYAGEKHGTNKYYDLNGKLRLTTSDIFGKEFGSVIRYYENGQKIYEYNSLNDIKDGEQIFYNLSGKAIASIGYAMDVIQYYRVLDASGNLGEPQKTIPTSDYQIVSNYPSGKTAFKLNISKGLFDQVMEIYSENGQLNYTCGFKSGLLNGKRIEYYANGKIYKSENLDENLYHGVQEYFSADGKQIISAMYTFDELHGELKVFENGTLVKHRVYDSDELVEIKL